MQHSDNGAKKTGNVLPLREITSENEPTPHQEAILGEKIVTILKEMFKSWRAPKSDPAR